MPHAVQYDIGSRADGREYRIFVAKPAAAPPPAGYPVVYALDANAVFGTLTEAMRVQGRRPERTGVVPAVIVGIGYRTEAPFDSARYYDYTLPAHASELPAKPDGGVWPEQGGADAFLRFLTEELKPAVESAMPIDTSRQTLFGHSLGGLFTLHALFAMPGSFRTYVAGSPSIHWNKRLLEEEERAFVSRLACRAADARLLIGVGELERGHKSGMYDNAKALSDRLAALSGLGLHTRFHEFEGEGHASVLPALVSRALRFASEGGG
ncbi:alpha/beta hydrolase [Paenibacillus sp. GYB003]